MEVNEQDEFKPGSLTSFVHSFKECVKELAKSEKEKLKSVSTYSSLYRDIPIQPSLYLHPSLTHPATIPFHLIDSFTCPSAKQGSCGPLRGLKNVLVLSLCFQGLESFPSSSLRS